MQFQKVHIVRLQNDDFAKKIRSSRQKSRFIITHIFALVYIIFSQLAKYDDTRAFKGGYCLVLLAKNTPLC